MNVCRFAIVTAFLLTAGQASAADKPLTDDPSRSDLFALMTSYKADAAPAPERQKYAFPLTFSFPHDAKWKDPILDDAPRSSQLFGVDLSHHNADDCHCMPNFAAMYDQEVRYAYLKASQGVQGFDNYYIRYRNAAKSVPADHRLMLGAYHFLSADGSGVAQAAHFLTVTRGTISADDLPPTLDLEWDVRVGPDHKVITDPNGKAHDFWTGPPGSNTPVPPDEILRRTLAYLSAVKAATGRIPLVYTNREWWRQRIGSESRIAALSGYPIWIADYGTSGRAVETPSMVNNGQWLLWQFSNKGRFTTGGLPSARTIDVNVFSGSVASFRTAMGFAD